MSHQERLTRLIGRDADTADLCRMIRFESGLRLITLAGPGGVGKTRLAMRAMDELSADFGGNIHFVDLAVVQRASDVPAAVANALNISVAADQDAESRVLGEIASCELLLVLDNFEHVMDAEVFVWSMLRRSRRLVVLITSREPLRLEGQRIFEVRPLDVPSPGVQLSLDEYWRYPAVQLFVERAYAARPDFALTDGSIGYVIESCTLLSGLPLAVELAAARLRHMSIRELLAGLDHMLDLLAKGPTSSAERHRSLRAALTWSYDLLTPVEQWAFRNFSVFRGGFTVATAGMMLSEYITSKEYTEHMEFLAFDGVSSLVDKSLVTVQEIEGETTRYQYLEPIRQFALERLRSDGEEEMARRMHGKVFLAQAEQAFTHLREEHPLPWITSLDREQSNMREALRWACGDDVMDGGEIALRITNALWLYWHMRGHDREALEWLEKGLSRAKDEISVVRADALLFLGHTITNDELRSRASYEDGRRIYHALGDHRGESGALSCLGMSAQHAGEYQLALRYQHESLLLFRRHGNAADVAHAEHQLGSIAATLGDYALSRTHFERARRAFERLGRTSELAYTLLELGRVAGLEERFEEAENTLLWSLIVFRKNTIADGEGRVLYELGMLALRKRDLYEANERFRRTLVFYREIDFHNQWRIAAAEGLSDIALSMGQMMLAVRLLAGATYWRDQTGKHPTPEQRRMLDRIRAQARREMSERAFSTAWQEGTLPTSLEASIEQAIALWPQPVTKQDAVPRAAVQKARLSPMQRIVLCQLADGKSNQQIADDLGRSVRTITTHVTAILQSIGAENRAGAAAFAVRNDVCPPP